MKTRRYQQNRRAEQTRAHREELLSAACRLIEGSGFHGLALEAVAATAGVSRGTVYNQFGSKLGLLEAVLDRVAELGRARELSAAAEDGDPATALRGLLDGHWRLWS